MKSHAVIGAELTFRMGKIVSELGNGSMVFLPLLLYCFFLHSFAASRMALYGCLFLSVAALVIHFIAKGDFARKRSGVEVVWIPFLLTYYMHCLCYGINNTVLLTIYTILFVSMYVTSSEKNWVTTCYKAIILFSLFHAIATIVLWMFPSIYPVLKDAFFSGSYMAKGYQSGFTNHYSTNAIYLSTGFVCWSCGLICSKKPLKAQQLVLAFAFLFALLLTTKRGPLIASIIAITLMHLFVNRQKFTGAVLRTLAFGVLAAGAFLFALTFVPGIDVTFERFISLADDETANGRTYLYEYAYEMIAQSPIFGSGWGSYSAFVARTPLGSMYSSIGFSSMSAHNVYLQLLAETGIVGLVFFVGAAVLSLRCALRTLRHTILLGSEGFSIYLAASCGFQLFFLVYCLSGNPLYDAQCYIPYFMACIAGFAIDGNRDEESKP